MAAENSKLQLAFEGMPLPEETGLSTAGKPLKKWKPDLRQVKVSDLPESLREISRLIGLPATLALAEWRGGTRLSVPREVHAAHPLARALGPHAARVLAAEYGGGQIHVPALSRVLAPLRDRTIRADYDAKAPIPDLVWRFGLTERRIHEILNRPEER